MLLFSERRDKPFKLIRLVDAALFYYISGGVLGYILIEPALAELSDEPSLGIVAVGQKVIALLDRLPQLLVILENIELLTRQLVREHIHADISDLKQHLRRHGEPPCLAAERHDRRVVPGWDLPLDIYLKLRFLAHALRRQRGDINEQTAHYDHAFRTNYLV